MQKWIKITFVIYILILIKLIIFKYPYEQLVEIAASWQPEVFLTGLRSANFVPFKTIKMYIEYSDRLNSFENLIGNILAFVPFGMMFPLMNAKVRNFGYVIFNAFFLVLGIELFQCLTSFGAFDVDDIILNCFGVFIGYAIYIKSRSMIPAFDKIARMEEEKYGADFEKN